MNYVIAFLHEYWWAGYVSAVASLFLPLIARRVSNYFAARRKDNPQPEQTHIWIGGEKKTFEVSAYAKQRG